MCSRQRRLTGTEWCAVLHHSGRSMLWLSIDVMYEGLLSWGGRHPVAEAGMRDAGFDAVLNTEADHRPCAGHTGWCEAV